MPERSPKLWGASRWRSNVFRELPDGILAVKWVAGVLRAETASVGESVADGGFHSRAPATHLYCRQAISRGISLWQIRNSKHETRNNSELLLFAKRRFVTPAFLSCASMRPFGARQSPPDCRHCDGMNVTASMSPARVAIIGAGISGLAAAHRLLELSRTAGRSPSITVYEAASRYGGLFGSQRIGDYLIELGADSFITNKPAAIKLCERLGIELMPTDARYRRSLILHHGRPVPTPDGFNLLAPGKIWPIVTTPLLSPAGKMRLAAELFMPRRQDRTDESLGEFVRRRFGKEVLERIVQPLVGGIYTSDPEKLSLEATLPRFPEMERRHGSLIRALRRGSDSEEANSSASGARYGLFATPKAGMQALLDRLRESLGDYVTWRFDSQVTALHRDRQNSKDRWHVATREAHESFDAVIVALPAYIAAELLCDSAGELAQALNQIEYASSAIVVSGHKLSDIAHPCDAFGLVIPHVERRRILATSFLSRKFPGRAPADRIILRTFVGGAMQPEELDCSDDQLVAKVLAELKSILGVGGTPDFVRIAHYRRSMPQYTVGHLERVAKIRQLASTLPGVALAGNAFDGVGVPDAIASGESAAATAWEALFPASEKAPAVA